MWFLEKKKEFISKEYPGKYFPANICPEKHISSSTAVFCETCGTSLLVLTPVRHIFRTNDFDDEFGNDCVWTEILDSPLGVK